MTHMYRKCPNSVGVHGYHADQYLRTGDNSWRCSTCGRIDAYKPYQNVFYTGQITQEAAIKLLDEGFKEISYDEYAKLKALGEVV